MFFLLFRLRLPVLQAQGLSSLFSAGKAGHRSHGFRLRFGVQAAQPRPQAVRRLIGRGEPALGRIEPLYKPVGAPVLAPDIETAAEDPARL